MLSQIIQRGPVGGAWGIGEWLIAMLVLLGVLAIAYLVVKSLGLPIPPVVWQIIGIVIAIGFGIVAIRFLLSL